MDQQGLASIIHHIEEFGELVGLLVLIGSVIWSSGKVGKMVGEKMQEVLDRMDAIKESNHADHGVIKKDARQTKQVVDTIHGEVIAQGKQLAKLEGRVDATSEMVSEG